MTSTVESSARGTAALLGSVLGVISEPAWVITRDLKLVAFNDTFRRYFGQLFGRPPAVGERIPDLGEQNRSLAPEWSALYRRALEGHEVVTEQWLVVGGVKRHFVVSAAPVADEGGLAAAVFIGRETSDRGLYRHNAIELALTSVFDPDDPLGRILERVIEFVCTVDDWDAGVVWIASADQDLSAAAIWCGPRVTGAAEFARATSALRFAPGRGVPGRVYDLREAIWVADLRDETGLGRVQIAASASLNGLAAVPMADGHRCVGVLELFTCDPLPVSSARHEGLTRTGAALTRLIERYRAEQEQKRLRDVIERKGHEWSLTFDAIELPIFLTNPEGQIVRLNRAARDLAGRSFRDLVGRRISDIGTAEPWKTVSELITAIAESRSACDGEITTDANVWQVSGNPFPAGGDYIVVVLRDLTALVRMQEAVRRGEQLAALGELVAGVAHEVRNPIFGMSAAVDAIEALAGRGSGTDDLVGVLRQSLERLNRLMENLLEYGKTWTLDLRQGCVREVMLQAVDACRPKAESRRIRIESSAEDGLTILMDPTRLTIAFENVITNAVQHSPDGGRIVVKAARTVEHGRTQVECVVRDEGPGFSPADLSRVFTPFFTRRRGGTGLGLSIVQRVIEEHGGTTVATNASDGGAVVRFLLPLHSPDGGSSEDAR